MDQSKRVFLQGSAAIVATLGFASLAVNAATAEGVVLEIEGYDGNKGPFFDQFTLNAELLQWLQVHEPAKRSPFLASILTKRLKKLLPDAAWSEIEGGITGGFEANLNSQLARIQGWSEQSDTPLPMLVIKLRFGFFKPNGWEYNLESLGAMGFL